MIVYGRCWVWDGCIKSNGYGQAGGGVLVHRAAYEMLVGPIPAGLQIDHRCRNRLCYNPANLDVVTAKENSRRRTAFITHCPAGHPYSPENTRTNTAGARCCRTCERARCRAYKAARRAA